MSKRKRPYEFRKVLKGKTTHIYTRLHDVTHQLHEVEVSEAEYEELVALNRSIRNIESSSERHNEYRPPSEEEQAWRSAPSAAEVFEGALLIQEVKDAFLRLPKTQARRYILIHLFGFSYAEVAQMEGCTRNAVKH
jgi:DNA-directed RNA polymerase specialized sigma24 family protein